MAELGLSDGDIGKIQRAFGPGALAKVKDNPYVLSRLFPLKIVDSIAGRLGAKPNSVQRAVAIVEYELDKALMDGHCYVHTHTLLAKARSDCRLQPTAFTEAHLESVDTIVLEGKYALLRPIRDAEVFVGEKLSQLLQAMARVLPETGLRQELDAIAALTKSLDRVRDLDQEQAIWFILHETVAIITGAPGTGKTYSITAALDRLDADHLSYALCAPTGKAARRMAEVTGRPASTIHRLLQWRPDGFVYNADNPLPWDVVVVDECFHWKQPVLTETGWQPIGRIVNSQLKTRMWSRNPRTAQLELKPIVRWLKKPAPRELVEIHAGRSNSRRATRLIRCTAAHKVLTPLGYVRAADLRVGDRLIVRGVELTNIQRSILVGSVLGDGALRATPARGNSPQPKFMQGVAQKAWLLFKRQIFGPLASKLSRAKSGFAGGKDVLSFNLRVTDTSTWLASQMVPAKAFRGSRHRRWAPTDAFLECADALAVAVWFLDNGSTGPRGAYASLHTERFTEADNHRIAAWFTARFGITPVVRATRKYFLLWFGREASTALFNLIRQYTPKCMVRKVPGATDFQPSTQLTADTTTAVVRTIKRIKTPTANSAHVYDLEVADHHNYVAGNIVVSNCSMIDIRLAADLLAAVNPQRTRIIFVGDANQLPPVGPGAFFSDLITSKKIPTVWLRSLHRAAAGSWIYRNAPKILAGAGVELDVDVPDFDWYEMRSDDAVGIKGTAADVISKLLAEGQTWDDFQLLTPMKIRDGGAYELNLSLRQDLIKNEGVRAKIGAYEYEAEVCRGDRVIQIKNDYELDIMNGECGQIALVETPSSVRVRFDNEYRNIKGARLKNLALSYALTTHKYQGSQAKTVIVICHSVHGRMLNRRLFYTAVTRAQKKVILIGDENGVKQAIRSVHDVQRRTQLVSRITA